MNRLLETVYLYEFRVHYFSYESWPNYLNYRIPVVELSLDFSHHGTAVHDLRRRPSALAGSTQAPAFGRVEHSWPRPDDRVLLGAAVRALHADLPSRIRLRLALYAFCASSFFASSLIERARSAAAVSSGALLASVRVLMIASASSTSPVELSITAVMPGCVASVAALRAASFSCTARAFGCGSSVPNTTFSAGASSARPMPFSASGKVSAMHLARARRCNMRPWCCL